ncbi:aldehyde dehydrogenase family protein [Nocardia sp. NPDC003693]
MTSTVTVPWIVQDLRRRQPAWEQSGVAERAKWLRRYADWLLDNQEHLVRLLCAEVGKPLVEGRIEFTVVIDLIKHLTRHAENILSTEQRTPPNLLNAFKTVSVTHRPYPVIAVITPWNFPLGLSLCDAIPALLAGAAVTIKPAPATPCAVAAAVAGWNEIGAPAVFTAITGDNAAGAELVELVDFVQFTGSTATGKAIAARCAERLIPCGLELGGKDPALVLSDADLDWAARGIAWGALTNAGQMCTSIERVYVDADVHDAFVARLVEHVNTLRRDIDVAALVTTAQFDIVNAHLEQAIEAGARVVSGGGTDPATRWVEPTVLVDVSQDMACVREETFGPLIPIIKVRDTAHAVTLANDSVYGLSATVWSRNHARAREVAAQLHAGAVNINDAHANVFFLSAPMDGWKQSGIGGRFGTREAVLRYCRAQTVTESRFPLRYQQHLLWFPYQGPATEILGRTMRALAATGTRRFRW